MEYADRQGRVCEILFGFYKCSCMSSIPSSSIKWDPKSCLSRHPPTVSGTTNHTQPTMVAIKNAAIFSIAAIASVNAAAIAQRDLDLSTTGLTGSVGGDPISVVVSLAQGLLGGILSGGISTSTASSALSGVLSQAASAGDLTSDSGLAQLTDLGNLLAGQVTSAGSSLRQTDNAGAAFVNFEGVLESIVEFFLTGVGQFFAYSGASVAAAAGNPLSSAYASALQDAVDALNDGSLANFVSSEDAGVVGQAAAQLVSAFSTYDINTAELQTALDNYANAFQISY